MGIFRSQDTQAEISAGTNSNRLMFSSLKLATSLFGWCVISHPLAAQISPDDTLGTETNAEDNVTEITGGTRRESNLFHSFQNFSVETDSTAFFNNGTDISNIIGRVTGSSISNIDGLIRANGEANLILINPNGISLGSNARLDIGGSFLGSTAESVVFTDGTVFNTDLDTPPLLTISTPVGLQLGQSSAEITILGGGDTDAGLSVASTTFSLVGNGITFDGGIVSAESGRIDLGSVAEGEVSIEPIAAGWQLGYEGVTEFAPLELLGGSALLNPNTSANSTGGIQLRGSEITLERSQITAQTLTDAPGGNVVINATESLILTGTAQMGENASQISNNVLGEDAGRGGSIEITTGTLDINPRSFIDNSVFGAGSAGNIEIVATEIDIDGAGFAEFQQQYRLNVLEGSLEPGSRVTGIFAGTATTGSVGDINITTDTLNLSDGAIIFTPVFTTGNGGDSNITAAEIDISASAIQSGAGVESVPTASVGNINLNSDRLNVTDGASVINATFGNASGGDVKIVAKAIDLNTTPPDSILGTGLYTNTTFGIGEGGDLQIDADTLNIQDAVIISNSGALLPDGTVIPFGGLGGNIEIQATESITSSGIIFDAGDPNLSVGAGIGTTTYSASDGGNLSIDTGKLNIRDGASFASSTFGAGDGGQLTINAIDWVELAGFAGEKRVNLEGLFATSGNNPVVTQEITGASGNISITTPNLEVIDGATIDVRSTNVGGAGSIKLTTDSTFIGQGSALSATTQDGTGGNIGIDTKTLQLDRGLINASVLGQGTGGNIEIVASDSMEVNGSGFEVLRENLFDPEQLSPEFLASLGLDVIREGILAISVGSGNAGKIDIKSEDLRLTQGALIATATAGSGSAGSIFLNSSRSLIIDGSFVSNNTLFNGRGGDVEIYGHQLEILRGGQITVSTLGSGDSGSVLINTSKSVTVAGDAGFPQTASNISVGAVPLPSATGNGGNLTINTPGLNIDGGAISIGSLGSGDGGRLEVDANSIKIDNQGSISADTESGKGANLRLEADNILWRGQSTTTATARGAGDGGNITIKADNLVALENSNITADAFMMGMGGNIQIDTIGLYLCQTCQVTASSQLGVDGVVNIETLEPNTILNLLDIPQQPTQPQEEVAVACPDEPGNSASRLTIIGRGGLPSRPQELLSERSLIEFEAPADTANNISSTPRTTLPAPARGWYRNDLGQVMLTARSMDNSISNSAINSLDCHK